MYQSSCRHQGQEILPLRPKGADPALQDKEQRGGSQIRQRARWLLEEAKRPTLLFASSSGQKGAG